MTSPVTVLPRGCDIFTVRMSTDVRVDNVFNVFWASAIKYFEEFISLKLLVLLIFFCINSHSSIVHNLSICMKSCGIASNA